MHPCIGCDLRQHFVSRCIYGLNEPLIFALKPVHALKLLLIMNAKKLIVLSSKIN